MSRSASLALAAAALPSAAAGVAPPPRVGDAVVIRVDREVTEQGSDGSSSSSSDRDGFIERVAAIRPDGVVLDYDFAPDTDRAERAGDWHLPVEVLKPARGALRLVDADALAKRVNPWLKAGGLTRAACGRWIFTWNAFRIDCDPASVLPALGRLQLTPDDLRAGTPFADPDASAPVPLVRAGPSTLRAVLSVDPDRIRRQEADADAMLADLSGPAPRPATIRRDRAAERIAGTITVTLTLDDAGRVRRRVRVARYTVTGADGVSRSTTATETTERGPLPAVPVSS